MAQPTIKYIFLNAKAILPARQTKGAAAYDVYACLEKDLTLVRGQIAPVPTGIAMEIPSGYHISIRARSGLAVKHGITPINSPGTIDADYRGEIFVPLINLGSADFIVRHGDRIAQLLLEKTEDIYWDRVDTLEKTQRGEGKFGSTGIGR
ncbi:MAG: Deoxyuridine 5'-triphosphate nucleotidohydrolase [Turneriella sp.]|nr:Deoxyuridine 5'-triphosphate nucleotidohydrolase [Turneriella sp.]